MRYCFKPNIILSFDRTSRFNKWMVFVGAYVVMVFNVGFLYSMGKLFVIILDTFHDTRAATATIQSVMYGVAQGSGKKII